MAKMVPLLGWFRFGHLTKVTLRKRSFGKYQVCAQVTTVWEDLCDFMKICQYLFIPFFLN